MSEITENKKVIIVGAGLAGLCCALELQERGIESTVLEADDRVGGRIKTDSESGFLLDHGFQVLLTSYPEAQKRLNYDQLNLGQFEPGALIRHNSRFNAFADPWRKPSSIFSTVFSPLATLGDKLRVARLRFGLGRINESDLQSQTQQSTYDFLIERGFSSKIIDRFFKPFFGGVFLESDLTTSSLKFQYLFSLFSKGNASLPENGMRSIPEQLANRLAPGTIELETPVQSLNEEGVVLADGRAIEATHTVLATPAHVTAKLLGRQEFPKSHDVACIYFAAESSPLRSQSLVLNGEGSGPVNSVCVPSDIAPSYAPPGQSLISVTVLGQHLNQGSETLLAQVKEQLADWFGDVANQWEHLKTYHIMHALPHQTPEQYQPLIKPPKQSDNIYVCGDHMGIASIQGAMQSGRLAAESLAISLQ